MFRNNRVLQIVIAVKIIWRNLVKFEPTCIITPFSFQQETFLCSTWPYICYYLVYACVTYSLKTMKDQKTFSSKIIFTHLSAPVKKANYHLPIEGLYTYIFSINNCAN